jgi:hypothetical protein
LGTPTARLMQVGGFFVPTLLVGFENNRTQKPIHENKNFIL